MLHLKSGLVLDDGDVLVVGYFESYEDPPVVIARYDETGTWHMSHHDFLSPISTLFLKGRPHVATLTGEVFDAETGDILLDLSSMVGTGASFNKVSSVTGQPVFLGYNAPPIAAFGTDLVALQGFADSSAPPVPTSSDGGPITLQDLQPAIDWAQSVRSYFDIAHLSDGRSIISGDGGRLYLIGLDLALKQEIVLPSREEMFITAVFATRSDDILCFGNTIDGTSSEIFKFNPDTAETTSLFTADGLCTFETPVELNGVIYVPNSSPAQFGGALNAGLIAIEGEQISEVPEFVEPCLACLRDGDTLWAIFDGFVARTTGGEWERLELPDFDLPEGYQ